MRHSTLSRATLHLLCGLLLILGAAPVTAGPNVLLLWDDDEPGLSTLPPPVAELDSRTQSLVAALEAADINVTLSSRAQNFYSGFTPLPNAFDVVIHLNGGSSALNIMPATGVSVLVDYVRQFNGAFIGGELTATQLTIPFGQGIAAAMADLMVIQRTSGVGVAPYTVFKSVGQENHPILQGLPSQFIITAARMVGALRTYSREAPVTLMRDERSTPAVAIREFGTGRIVSFNHAGNTGSGSVLENTNFQRVYVNAVYWADRLPPRATAITRSSAAGSVGGDLSWDVAFTEGVSGVDADDFGVDRRDIVLARQQRRVEIRRHRG